MLYKVAGLAPFFVCLFSFLGLLFSNFRTEKPKLVLSIFMLGASVYFGIGTLKIIGKIELYSYFYTSYLSLVLVSVPALYFYIGSLCGKNIFKLRQLFHFVPFIVLFVTSGLIFFQLSFPERILFLKSSLSDFYIENTFMHLTYIVSIIIKFILIIQIVTYTPFAIKSLNFYRKEINEVFSYNSGLKLNWVTSVFIVFITMAIVCVVAAYNVIDNISFKNSFAFLIDLINSAMFFGLYLLGSKQVGLLGTDSKNNSYNGDEKNSHLKQKLLHLFVEKEIYLKPELSIWDVCKEINSNRTYISNIINQEFQMNFNTFVNGYRLKKAKEILGNKEFNEYSMEKIAQISGFNSLASFNRAFQRIENKSPGYFRNN